MTARVITTAPAEIFLNIGADCPEGMDFGELREVSWPADDADGNGIRYVRADLSPIDLRGAGGAWERPDEPSLRITPGGRLYTVGGCSREWCEVNACMGECLRIGGPK